MNWYWTFGVRHAWGATTVAIRPHHQKTVTSLYSVYYAIEVGIPIPNPDWRSGLCIRDPMLPRAAGHLWPGLPGLALMQHCPQACSPPCWLQKGGRRQQRLCSWPSRMPLPPHRFSPVFLYPGSNRSLWLWRPLWGNSSHRRLPGLPGGNSGRTLRSLLWQWQQQD